MWAIVIKIVELALVILADVLLSRPKQAKSSPGNFSPPTADATIPVTVVFGTAKVQPNVMWWSDQRAYKFTKKGQPAGFTYHARIAFGICFGPIDALLDIIADNTRSHAAYAPGYNRGYPVVNPAFPSLLPGDGLMRQITIVADGIFGGPDHEGGLAGTVELQYGTDTQVANSTLNPVANTSPPYKRLCYAVFTDNGPEAPTRPFYWGTSSQLKAIHFVVKRCPNLLGHGAMPNGLDANPVECIYEILTDTWWGRAMPTAALGPSWATAAATLQTEGLGISKVLTDPSQLAYDVIAELLGDIGASTYTDPLTGLFEIRLVRDDYVVANLPIVSPELNAHDLEFTRTTYRDLPTGVKITFTNRAKGYVDDVATWQNPAAVDSGGGEERWQEIAMPSITDATTAAMIAQREGRALTLPFAKATFKVDRSMYQLTQAAPFLLRWPQSGIPDTVMRVAAIDYGDLTTGEIDITAAEDVFFSTGSMLGVVAGSGSGAPLAPSNLVSAPDVNASTVETSADETLTLDVDDPSGVVLASHGVQYQTQVGGGAVSAWTDFAQIVTPYSVVITKASRPTVVNWRVRYTDQQGNTDAITGTITVAAIAAPTAPKLTINVDGSGNVTVDWVGDPLTTGVKIAASKVAYPSAATTRAASLSAGQTGTTGTLVTLAAGEVVYVTAFAYTSDSPPLESALAKATNNNAAPGTYIPLSQKGAASGVATLDGSGLVPTSQIPPLAISQPFVVASQAAMLALTAQRGDVAIRTDISETFILSTDNPGTLADWLQVLSPAGGVSSFNTRTGAVTPASGDYTVGQVTGAAPLASPALTGTPTAPTAAPGTNTTQLATTAFVTTAVGGGGGGGVAVDVQVFAANGTWTKPAGVTLVEVVVVGAGGGGGGAVSGSSTTTRTGGAGGGGGALARRLYRASDLTSSVAVTVGAGGAGGAHDSDGGVGGTSSFGAYLNSYGGGNGKGALSAFITGGGTGGGTGGPGQSTGTAGALGGYPQSTILPGRAPGVGGGGAGSQGNAAIFGLPAEYGGGAGGTGSDGPADASKGGGQSLYGGGGGGGGGGINTANSGTAGASGGLTPGYDTATGGGGAAGGTGTGGNAGAAGAAGDSTKCGGGGGGGASNTGGTGGAGGVGGAPGGGGGGGGGGTTGGAGGAGGRGEVRVYSW